MESFKYLELLGNTAILWKCTCISNKNLIFDSQVTFDFLVDLGVDSASELNNRPRLNYNLTRIQNRKLRVDLDEHPAIRDLDEHQCYTTDQHFKAVFSNMVREGSLSA